MSVYNPGPAPAAVRFNSQIDEIEPEHSLEQVRTLTGHDARQDLSPEAKQELRSLAVTMQVRLSPTLGRLRMWDHHANIATRKHVYRTSTTSQYHYQSQE